MVVVLAGLVGMGAGLADPTVAGALPGGMMAAQGVSTNPGDWPMFNRDPSGSRHNSAETRLGPDSVGGLRMLWSLPTAAVHGTPAVVGDTVYAGDAAGVFYAVNTATGVPRWVSAGHGPITASALVAGDVVIFGDLGGVIHGLNRVTGLPAWPPLRPDSHPLASVIGSPTLAGDKVVVGISSLESLTPCQPGCTSRGSIVALEPTTGHLLWQTFTISDAEAAQGSSGASVWSTPTYDADTNLAYVGTGQNYSEPATSSSDAVLALDAGTGRIVWRNQLYPNDVWNIFLPPDGHDYDVGDSPQVFRLRNGRKVVGAGQKSGFLHILDATTGKLLNNRQLEPGGQWGGVLADTAYADGVTFASGVNWIGVDPSSLIPEPPGLGSGDLIAVRSDMPGQLTELWRFHTPDSPNVGAVAVANHVVYFHSSRAGILYALHAETGAVLASLNVGVAINGPSVSHGRVFLGTGDYEGTFDTGPAGAIMAFGLP